MLPCAVARALDDNDDALPHAVAHGHHNDEALLCVVVHAPDENDDAHDDDDGNGFSRRSRGYDQADESKKKLPNNFVKQTPECS